MVTLNKLPRAAGILLHPTSFRTPYGIGDLGPQAYKFLDFLHQAHCQFWQVLPLGLTGYADSPYQSLSAFAGNPLLISPDLLIENKFISQDSVLDILSKNSSQNREAPVQWVVSDKINYQKIIDEKTAMLEAAFQGFRQKKFPNAASLHKSFHKFVQGESFWLEDFVLFYSIKKFHKLDPWVKWDVKYRTRDAPTLTQWRESHQEELEFYRFCQWIFIEQWNNLHRYANTNGIQIIGDMPIFVAHDSADVWSHPEFYTLNPDGSLQYQAGVPPDYFSKTGQLWGNPLYRWEELQRTGFDWWIRRFQRLIALVDWVRIDHFRGFQAYWQILGTEKTAIKGKWIEAPGEALFTVIKDKLGMLPILAEDLGVITPEVEELRDMFGFPGMKVMQFAFSGDPHNPHLPHNYRPYSLAYLGTHDNNTTFGWWQKNATESEKQFTLEYINSNGLDIVGDLIKTLFRSVATLVLLPIQDILGQGSEARMNTPSTTDGNWQYIIPPDAFTEEKVRWLGRITEIYGRAPQKIKEE